jgi:hypothetical protein
MERLPLRLIGLFLRDSVRERLAEQEVDGEPERGEGRGSADTQADDLRADGERVSKLAHDELPSS